MKKFNNFNKINEEITYEQLGLKSPTYEDNVKSHIVYIIMEENHVSEKSFKEVEKIQRLVDDRFNDISKIKEIINDFKENKSRVSFCAELIYDKYKNLL